MMAKYGDALRGYAASTLKRDQYVCSYCGLDGKIWPNWLYFSWDHLLPKGHEGRDCPDFIVAACTSCNTFANRTVFDVDGKTPAQLVEQKRPIVLARREEYRLFWEQVVKPSSDSATPVLPATDDESAT
jgi:HNH endonuclease